LDAELRLGQGLSEEKLAVALGVGRTTVRDALIILRHEGLIDVQPQRGSFVFLPSPTRLAHLCEYREMLETHALSLCYESDKNRTIIQMTKACEMMNSASNTNNHLDRARADGEFHEAFIDNCKNEYLIEAYGLIAGQVATLRAHLRTTDQDRAIGEHRAIIDALVNDDLARAKMILSGHILRMRDRYVLGRKSGTLIGATPAASSFLEAISL
jgi:DNA-binding GntR family transcriptional regulator